MSDARPSLARWRRDARWHALLRRTPRQAGYTGAIAAAPEYMHGFSVRPDLNRFSPYDAMHGFAPRRTWRRLRALRARQVTAQACRDREPVQVQPIDLRSNTPAFTHARRQEHHRR